MLTVNLPALFPCSGSLISNATVRLLRPQCDFLNNWLEESSAQQAKRIIDILYTQSVPEHKDTFNQSDCSTERNLYSPTSFAFMFYFLNCVLMDNGDVVGRNEGVMGKALQLISEHSQMRKTGDDTKVCGCNLNFSDHIADYISCHLI